MWKRLNNPKGSRPPISELMMIDSFDDRPYSRNTGLGIVNRRPSPRDTLTGNPPLGPAPRPPREDEMGPKGLPRLPFEPVQLPDTQPQDSRFRPASSIYLQPSLNPITTRFPQDQYETTSTLYTEEEVSPPSSPEYNASLKQRGRYQPDDQEVSPIDEMPDFSRLAVGGPASRPDASSNQPSSSIPVLRRENRRNQVPAQVSTTAANLVSRKAVGGAPKSRKIVDTRWDPFSGEITTSEKGKPQSVKPGSFTPPGLRPIHKQTGIALGNESRITGGAKSHKTSFSDRVRNLKGKNEVPAERPEWQGATRTGRTAIVSPVEERYDLPPISIPLKSSRRVASPHSGSYSGSLTPVTIVRSDDGETSPASAYTSDSEDTTDPTIAAMLASGRDSPRITPSPIYITPDPVIVGHSAAAKTFAHGNPEPTEVSTLPKTDSAGTIERNFREALKEVSFSGSDSADPYMQPPSRFSVTTYTSSEAQSTPRPSTDTFDRPPMPTPPQILDAQQSVLNRKRPTIGLPASPKSTISRKAVGADQPIVISIASSIAMKRSSNPAKNLPITPAEAQSHDLVSSLQAQLDDLANRRNNIQKSIRQMTQLMPKDSVLLTEDVRRKREAEKIKVEALRVEEADIKREEHDIGLRLHRAWKRRDRNAEYEPTGLWVRRVTG